MECIQKSTKLFFHNHNGPIMCKQYKWTAKWPPKMAARSHF